MSPGKERVLATYAGLSPRLWRQRLVMVLQVYIDDSGNEPSQEVFVLGGVLSHAPTWLEFGAKWDAALAGPPKADYFKYTQASRLRGQFDEREGWTETLRDDRLFQLSELVHDHALARIDVSMRYDHFNAYVRSVPVTYRSLISDHPIAFMVGRAISCTVGAMAGLNLRDRCDFFFDTQPGWDVLITALWPSMLKAPTLDCPPDLLVDGFSPQLGETPKFEKDEEYPPLQAADLIAGSTRQGLLTGEVPRSLIPTLNIPAYRFELSEDDVRGIGAGLVARMDVLKKENPEVILQGYDPDHPSGRARRRSSPCGCDGS